MSSVKRGDKGFYQWKPGERTPSTGFEVNDDGTPNDGYQREDSADIAFVSTVIKGSTPRVHIHVLREHKFQPLAFLRNVPVSEKPAPGSFTLQDPEEDKALDEATRPAGATNTGSKA